MDDGLKIGIDGHLLIRDETHDEVMLDQHNAIHPQNMSRILARGLANEPNSIIGRIAFGNGGTFLDVGSNLVFNPPNVGEVAGWESRLYSEAYSEIINEESADFQLDLGSSGPGVIRPGGGSVEENDPAGGGVISEEVGTKSNVVLTVFLNESEPTGQDQTILEPATDTFIFDEIGLYSPGKQAANSPGYNSIDVGNKTSFTESPLNAPTYKGEKFRLKITVNNSVDDTGPTKEYIAIYSIPTSGTGTGGEITYGDICEGINTGGWADEPSAGQAISDNVTAFITDDSNGLYNSMGQRESYGFFTFVRNYAGDESSVTIDLCNDDATDGIFQLPYILALDNECTNVNVNSTVGESLGASNDAADTTNERERLLTHIIFTPIPKANDVAISITYTLTISVLSTSDTVVSII
jgi:hypothetical protein